MKISATIIAAVLLTGCTAPADFEVQPYASPAFTRIPVHGGTTNVDPIPSPSRKKVSRSRTRSGTLPTILLRIRSCESGPNGYATDGWAFDFDYRATNPRSTASGAWQALNGTWDNWGGYSRALYAPPHVQDAFALDLYRRRGVQPWTASRPCWSK